MTPDPHFCMILIVSSLRAMMTNKTIFGLRFRSNAELHPTQEELSDFLESMKKEGNRQLHGDDLAPYRELLEDIQAFERHRLNDRKRQNFRGKMFYEVLSHSQFFNPALKSAVEQYKFFFQALTALDFKKPATFIKTAEAEIKTLNPKNHDHATRLARLREMVDARKQTLATLKRRWVALAEELGRASCRERVFRTV